MAEYRQPKWVMCGVCGAVIYGGKSSFPIARICDGELPHDPKEEHPDKIRCRATAVFTGAKGRVGIKWDKQVYAAYGADMTGPLVEYADGNPPPDVSKVAVEETTLDDQISGHLEDMFGPGGFE